MKKGLLFLLIIQRRIMIYKGFRNNKLLYRKETPTKSKKKRDAKEESKEEGICLSNRKF